MQVPTASAGVISPFAFGRASRKRRPAIHQFGPCHNAVNERQLERVRGRGSNVRNVRGPGRSRRNLAAMPVLRGTSDFHQDVRTRDATLRSAAAAPANRDDRAVLVLAGELVTPLISPVFASSE
jgi:hypothetical protein